MARLFCYREEGMPLSIERSGMQEVVQGPFANLRAEFPTLEIWMASDPADMAAALLRDLKTTGGISAHNLWATFREHSSRMGLSDYQLRLGPLLEAYAWLVTHGLLAPNPNQPEQFEAFTRKAKSLDGSGFNAYRRAQVSLYDALDSRISQKVWSIYLRGDYDIAIAYAFKVVEVLMREKAGLPTSDYSERLVKKFFRAFEPPEGRESNGLSPTEYLFIGALKRYRNEAVHEPLTIDNPDEAMEILLLANHCLRVVESAAPSATAEHGTTDEAGA